MTVHYCGPTCHIAVAKPGDRCRYHFDAHRVMPEHEHCVVCGHEYHEQGNECEDPDGCPCWAGGS